MTVRTGEVVEQVGTDPRALGFELNDFDTAVDGTLYALDKFFVFETIYYASDITGVTVENRSEVAHWAGAIEQENHHCLWGVEVVA